MPGALRWECGRQQDERQSSPGRGAIEEKAVDIFVRSRHKDKSCTRAKLLQIRLSNGKDVPTPGSWIDVAMAESVG